MSSHELVRASSISRSQKRTEVKIVDVIGFAVVLVLWIAFAGALFFSQSSIHDMWAWFTEQTLWLQVPLGILFLPWVIGMWIWESSWPVIARGVLVGGLGWGTVYAFFPWKALA